MVLIKFSSLTGNRLFLEVLSQDDVFTVYNEVFDFLQTHYQNHSRNILSSIYALLACGYTNIRGTKTFARLTEYDPERDTVEISVDFDTTFDEEGYLYNKGCCCWFYVQKYNPETGKHDETQCRYFELD